MAHDMAKGRLATPDQATMETIRERYGHGRSQSGLTMSQGKETGTQKEGENGQSGLWESLKDATGYLMGWGSK